MVTKEAIAIELNMKHLRKSSNLTQSDVGKAVGVSKVEISRIERGLRKPSHETLCKLEELFGKPHNYLLAEAGKEAS